MTDTCVLTETLEIIVWALCITITIFTVATAIRHLRELHRLKREERRLERILCGKEDNDK